MSMRHTLNEQQTIFEGECVSSSDGSGSSKKIALQNNARAKIFIMKAMSEYIKHSHIHKNETPRQQIKSGQWTSTPKKIYNTCRIYKEKNEKKYIRSSLTRTHTGAHTYTHTPHSHKAISPRRFCFADWFVWHVESHTLRIRLVCVTYSMRSASQPANAMLCVSEWMLWIYKTRVYNIHTHTQYTIYVYTCYVTVYFYYAQTAAKADDDCKHAACFALISFGINVLYMVSHSHSLKLQETFAFSLSLIVHAMMIFDSSLANDETHETATLIYTIQTEH